MDTGLTFEEIGIDFWEPHPTMQGVMRQVFSGVSIAFGKPLVIGYELYDLEADKRYVASSEDKAVRVLKLLRPSLFWE